MAAISVLKKEVSFIVTTLARAVLTEIFSAAEEASLNQQNSDAEVSLPASCR